MARTYKRELTKESGAVLSQWCSRRRVVEKIFNSLKTDLQKSANEIKNAFTKDSCQLKTGRGGLRRDTRGL